MKIEVTDFDAGIEFTITAVNDTERALLLACVDEANHLTTNDNDDYKFILTLPVSN